MVHAVLEQFPVWIFLPATREVRKQGSSDLMDLMGPPIWNKTPFPNFYQCRERYDKVDLGHIWPLVRKRGPRWLISVVCCVFNIIFWNLSFQIPNNRNNIYCYGTRHDTAGPTNPMWAIKAWFAIFGPGFFKKKSLKVKKAPFRSPQNIVQFIVDTITFPI